MDSKSAAMNGPVSAQELIEHTGFLRCLARELVGDEHAEDMVQDALVSALEKPPRQRDSLRGWLAIVVRNRARTSMRAERRRDQREERSARPELQGSGDLALEWSEIQRVLSDLVVALPDAQRTVLHLRYYEGLTLIEIVERLDCASIATVQRHIACALDELRRDLDARSNGDRTAWVSALVPVTGLSWAGRLFTATSTKVGVGVVAVSTVWLTWQMMSEVADGPVLTASSATLSTPIEKEPLDTTSPLPADQYPGREVAPGEKQVGIVQGVIRSRNGAPLSGATVRWLALGAEDIEANPVWRTIDWGWLERVSRTTTSEKDGSYCFEGMREEERPNGAVLLVLHPQHLARCVELSVDDLDSRSAIDVTLELSDPVTISVVDAEGRAVPHAVVRHVACTQQPVSTEDFALSRARRFLMDEATTDDQGQAHLACFSGEQVFWARDANRTSVPWQGSHPRRVTIRLGNAFTLGGTLSLPTWNPDYTGERRILVTGMVDDLWRPLGRLRDVQEGAWGPVMIALDGVSRFRVRLEGSPIIPLVEEFSPPEPTSHRHLPLVAEKGVDLLLVAQDASGKRIPTARAEVWWADPGVPGGTNRVEFAATAEGEINAWSFPPGIVEFRVEAPGYASCEGYQEVPVQHGLVITLERGGSIAGRCLLAGKPVPDFEVIYRREGNVPDSRSRTFLGRDDGSFEIDGLTPGGWYVSASSSHVPGGTPLLVTVKPEEVATTELHLARPIRGLGRVIAAATGEPLSEASVQVFSGGLERSLPWGAPIRVSGDGSFDRAVFVPGMNFITVSAPGHAARSLEKRASATETLDWGEVPLFRPQSLTASLLALDELQGISAGDLHALGVSTSALPKARFGADGRVVFESVSPGNCQLIVEKPNGDWIRTHVELVPGADWHVECKIAGDRKLDVYVTDPDGNPLSYVPGVLLTATEETGLFVVRYGGAWDGLASFQGLRATRLEATVVDSTFTTVATKQVSFGSENHQEIEIRVGDAPLRIRIVDGEGNPIAGAWVRTRSYGGAEVLGGDDTDSEGWAVQFGLPPGTVLLDVEHGIAGTRHGVPIDASAREVEVVLAVQGSLGLRLVDGDDVLSNVSTRIETSGGVSLSDAHVTDAEGRIVYEHLGEGDYSFGCSRSDCWPSRFEKHLATDEHARVDVQMRRLADLELTALGRDGMPISGLAIALRSVEFGVGVESWIEEQRVTAPGGLTTSLQGRILIEGLPRGSYVWSADVEGLQRSGTLELRAAETNDVTIRLD